MVGNSPTIEKIFGLLAFETKARNSQCLGEKLRGRDEVFDSAVGDNEKITGYATERIIKNSQLSVTWFEKKSISDKQHTFLDFSRGTDKCNNSHVFFDDQIDENLKDISEQKFFNSSSAWVSRSISSFSSGSVST